MPRSPLAILACLLLLVQSVLGGLGGAAVLCLGGDHDHGHEIAAASTSGCTGACEHHGDVRIEVVPDHAAHHLDHEHCGCIDVHLPAGSPIAPTRALDAPTSLPPVHREPMVVAHRALEATGPPPAPRWRRADTATRLAILATIRLRT